MQQICYSSSCNFFHANCQKKDKKWKWIPMSLVFYFFYSKWHKVHLKNFCLFCIRIFLLALLFSLLSSQNRISEMSVIGREWDACNPFNYAYSSSIRWSSANTAVLTLHLHTLHKSKHCCLSKLYNITMKRIFISISHFQTRSSFSLKTRKKPKKWVRTNKML